MDNYVGKRLDGRYEVQEIIGVGGMSVVYKAYDNIDDRIVAVKILKEEFLNNEEFRRRFKNESKAIALLSHPNIVKVFDVNFGEKLQYIVMEYIDGITLKEYINKLGAITWNDALFFMTQILRAVQHAHDKGIVHRDIKPQNIILLPTGNIKVTDFGIARFSRSETKTLTDQAIGSVHYIAPEQAKGEYTDEKADVYSLGVVLYEMLAGKVPFEAENPVSVALMQLQADAKRLTDINPDIPLGLEQICIHAMQKNPLDRYQTATEILLDIEEVIKNPSITFNYATKIDSNPTRVVNKNDVITHRSNDDFEPVDDLDEDEDLPDPDHKKKVITAVSIGVIVLVAAVVLLIMSIAGMFNTSTQKLESFVGMSYDELRDNKAYNYDFVAEYEKTDSQQVGTVIRQSPEAGTKVLEGSKITLYVAASENDIAVPNVYKLELERAQEVLKAQNLTKFKVVSISSETVKEGEVVYTDPKATMAASPDTEITIYVSTGPSTTVIETIRVPDVNGLTQTNAEAFLKKYGFTNISYIVEDSLLPKGTVISQSPGDGAMAKSTDSIKLVISSGTVTTTTQKSVKVVISVKLPICKDSYGEYLTDTIKVSVDGETYLNQTIELNGKVKKITVLGDGESKQSIRVSLGSTSATETIVTNGKNNQNFDVDFTAFSSNDAIDPSDDVD